MEKNISSNNNFRCVASGDAMITLRLPQNGSYAGFDEVKNFIQQGDFCFSNLETTIHNFECFGAAQSGGSWLCSPPGVIEDMKKFGFNILSTANNHATDYSFGGLLRTIDYLKAANIPFSGTGSTLLEASQPAYIDTQSGRYALISCTSSFNPEALAGEQTRMLPGRPGVNGIRFGIKYRLPQVELDRLNQIAQVLHLNDRDNIIRSEGYLPQLKAGEQPFGKMMFEAGEPQIVYTINESDMKRICDAIAEAHFMADYVVVSFHNHELYGEKENVDPLSKEFCRRCVDAGADAVIGTGPHLLRPMEIYHGKPIFYCLGDFIIQLETVQRAPNEMFIKEKLNGNSRLDELFETRSNHGKRGLCYSRVMFESVIPYWEVNNGELQVLKFMPIEENFGAHRGHMGWPRPNFNSGIMERFAEMCQPFGVDMDIVDGYGIVKL